MKIKLLSALVLVTISSIAHANEVNGQALQACTYIENDVNRLLCYDKTMAGKSLSRTNTQTSSSSVAPSTNDSIKGGTALAAGTAATATLKQATVDDFGLEHKEIAKNGPEEIQASIKSVKEAPYGELIISLSNDQQWRQIGSDSLRLSENDEVIISRGVFNSFLLKKVGQNRSIRVKRTQ